MTAAEKLGKVQYIPWIPGEKLRIAVMYQVASFWPSVESFYQACLEDEAVEVRIFHIDELSVERAQVTDSNKFLRDRGIPYTVYSETALRAYRPHAALYQVPYDMSFRNPSTLSVHLRNMGIRIIYIPYGIEIADTEDTRLNHFSPFTVRNCWRLYTFSETMKADYEHYCPNRHAVRALGVPKFDALFRKDIPADPEIIRRAAGRKTVLWKLHFPKLIYDGLQRRQVTPYLSEYRKFAEELGKYPDLFFVMMPHPMFFSHTIDRSLTEEARKLFQLLESQENVLLDRGTDYRKALYHANAIIIDRSALMVEAGFCDVPVLYMKNADYEEPLTAAVKLLVDAYMQGTTAEDMKRFVEAFRENGLSALTDRILKTRAECMPPADGKCGERILADIKQGVQESAVNHLRLVLFGASFICEHYLAELKLKSDPEVEILCLSDNDAKKWGTFLDGIEVVPPERLKELDFDLLVITSEHYYMSIKKQLVYDIFLEEKKILPLDEFVERYGKGFAAQ